MRVIVTMKLLAIVGAVLVALVSTAMAQPTEPLSEKATGTFVGELKASVITRDKQRCRVSSEARLTLHIAPHGVATYRGYNRFEIACPGQPAPPSSCWAEGVATVAAASKDQFKVETLSTSKVAGPVPADRAIWKCGHVEVAVPLNLELDRSCVRLGSRANRSDEIGAQLTCEMGHHFPALENGTLRLTKKGELTFPWDVGSKPFVLKRVSPTPVEAPPQKLYDDFGCRFDSQYQRVVKKDVNERGYVPEDLVNPAGTVEEYCEALTTRGVRREGPFVATLPDGNVSERYVYKDGRLVSGAAWWANGNVRMFVEAKDGKTLKTFFTKDGARSSVELDGRPVAMEQFQAPDVTTLKRGSDLRVYPRTPSSDRVSTRLEAVQPSVEKCVGSSKVRGLVEIAFDVAADGSVKSTEVIQSPHNQIAECIAAAVKVLTFEKTQSGGSFRFPVQIGANR